MRASGYLGAHSTIRAFVSRIREKKNTPEALLELYKEYIRKRLEESKSVSTKKLFAEMQTNGYLGNYNTFRAFVSTIREKKNTPEALIDFHKEYINKRLEEAALKSVSAKQIFEEIKAKGYQGTLKTTQVFLSTIRTSSPHEASLEFHKAYIKKRVGEAALEYVPTKQLFEEIKANGYLGALNTVAGFVSMIRKHKSSEGPPSISQRFSQQEGRKEGYQ